MESVVEALEGNKVKLNVTISVAEFEPAIDAAWKTIAKEVRIPGFRPGRVPRKVLEARIEPGYARSEALQQAVPDFYVRAVREHDVDVIDQPTFDITAGEEDGDVTFEATVLVRPEIELTGYQGLSVEVPNPEPTDDDIADHIDRFRGQYAEVVTVDRPAAAGDLVVIDIAGTQDGEPVDRLTASDFTYEVGSGSVLAELDDHLRGLKAGEVATFDAQVPSATPAPADDDDDDEDAADDAEPSTEPASFRVEVKEVRERVLPDLDDEWVADATEFDTVDAFRDDVIERVTADRKQRATMVATSRIGDALAELVADELPEPLVGGEVRARLESLIMRLQQQGIDLATYLEVTGTSSEDFMSGIRGDAERAIKVDLAFRAIVRNEGLAPNDDELEAEIVHLAGHYGLDVDTVRAELESNDQISAVRSDLGRRNALRWLADTIDLKDESGRPVTRAMLDLEEHVHDEHEHDHDHDGHDHDDHDDHDHD